MKAGNDFAFTCPAKVLCGRLALDHLPVELVERGAKKPLFLFDLTATKHSLPRIVHKALANSGLVMGVIDYIPERPEPDQLRDLREWFLKSRCDAVIGVGRGWVADMAKCLARFGDGNEARDFNKALPPEVFEQTLPLGIVPPADATGFEASSHLETVFPESRFIQFMPDLVVIDPRTTIPRTHSDAIDAAVSALASTVEQAVLPQGNPFIGIYAQAAIHELASQLAVTAESPSRIAAVELAAGIAYAGLSLGDTVCGPASRLAQRLAESGTISAANAVMLALPVMLQSMPVYRKERLARLLGLLAPLERLGATDAADNIRAAIGPLLDLFNRLMNAAPERYVSKLEAAGLAKTDLDAYAKHLADDGTDKGLVRRALSRIWSGTSADNHDREVIP